ncbi:MAG: sulfotransferase [Phenylobacterium sp.]|nr:sulfotransferase [Phenylobacterium sp.]
MLSAVGMRTSDTSPISAVAVGLDRGPSRSPVDLYDLLGYHRRWRLLSLATPTYVSDTAPIVVGGCPRSGTTLTQALLGCHPQVAAGPESTIFLRRITEAREIDARFGFAPGSVEDLQRRSGSQAEFIDLFQQAWLERCGKPIWAEKTPWNVLRLGFLWRHFPGARFIHVIRDGRDVACSLRGMPWAKITAADRSSAEALEECAAYWGFHVAAGRRYRHDPRYYEVRYEDLVGDPERTVRRLLAFLGLDWNDAVLEADGLHEALTKVGHANSNQPGRTIHRDALERWRTDLSAAERRIVEQAAGGMLARAGYLPS